MDSARTSIRSASGGEKASLSASRRYGMKAVIAVVLAASAISCPAWEEGPGTMHQRDSAPLRQARMALIALRAAKTVSSEVKERQYAIHPSRRLVGDLEAASLLADYPKPVSCASSVSDG